MGWAPQAPGSWPYLEPASQHIHDLRAAADRENLARLGRRSRRARRWLLRPAGLAASVNRLLGSIISPPWAPDDRFGPSPRPGRYPAA